MGALAKQPRGVRLSDETWTTLRHASISGGVSAASLMESLCSYWIRARDSGEMWADEVVERAQVIQREVNRARMLKKTDISPQTPENAD